MIANVALPKIQGTFACTQDQIALVVTFNIVATAVVTPASGWLASRFSRRNILISCVSGFIISSTFCGLSQNLEQLVIFQILQGGFGAPLVPIAMAMVLDTFHKKNTEQQLQYLEWGWSLDLLLGQRLVVFSPRNLAGGGYFFF